MSDPVNAFRAISWLIVKWSLIVIAVLVLTGALIVGGIYGHRWYTHERHAANVAFIIKYDDKECEQPFPLHMIVGNRSERTINQVSFWLEARRPGYSSNLAKFDTYSNDKIIPPGKGWGICWKVPQLTEKVEPSSLEWKVVQPSVTFAE